MRHLSRGSLARLLQVVLRASWYIIIARLGLEAVQIAAVYFGWLTGFPGLFRPLVALASLFGTKVVASQYYLAPQYYTAVPPAYANMLLARLLLVDLPSSLVTLYVVRVVGQMGSTLVTDRPFITENAARVQRIGLAFLVLTAWNWLIRLLSLTVVPDLVTTLFGLLLLVMAEIFRHGAELQEDHDLTV